MDVGFLPALEAHKKPLKWPFRGFRGLEGFRPGKRQAWTPIKSHGCGLLPALEAHKKPLKWPVRGFRGLEGFRPLKWPSDARWLRMPGERHAGPPRNSNGSGLGVAFACAGSP